MLLGDVVTGSFRYYRSCPGAQPVILRELMDNGLVPVDRLIDVIWGHALDGGPLFAYRAVHVAICHLRKRLRPGWHIINRHGRGYELQYTEPIEWRKAA